MFDFILCVIFVLTWAAEEDPVMKVQWLIFAAYFGISNKIAK